MWMICKVQREGSERLERLIGGDFDFYFVDMVIYQGVRRRPFASFN